MWMWCTIPLIWAVDGFAVRCKRSTVRSFLLLLTRSTLLWSAMASGTEMMRDCKHSLVTVLSFFTEESASDGLIKPPVKKLSRAFSVEYLAARLLAPHLERRFPIFVCQAACLIWPQRTSEGRCPCNSSKLSINTILWWVVRRVYTCRPVRFSRGHHCRQRSYLPGLLHLTWQYPCSG